MCTLSLPGQIMCALILPCLIICTPFLLRYQVRNVPLFCVVKYCIYSLVRHVFRNSIYKVAEGGASYKCILQEKQIPIRDLDSTITILVTVMYF